MNVKVVVSVGSIPPVLCSVTHVLLRISTWKLIIDVINETKPNYIPILQYIYMYYANQRYYRMPGAVIQKSNNGYINKGNNKITELRAILQRESQNS
jgi:hypothetical protein